MEYKVYIDDQFDKELNELVKEMEAIGLKTSIPELLVRLAKGHSLADIREYERSKVK